MTGPDFHDLVGGEGTPEELAQLRRAHELLIAAGPPPELSPRLAEAPSAIGRTSWLPQRRRAAALALAAGVAAAAGAADDVAGPYGATRSFATNAACVTGIFSAKNCSTASAYRRISRCALSAARNETKFISERAFTVQ